MSSSKIRTRTGLVGEIGLVSLLPAAWLVRLQPPGTGLRGREGSEQNHGTEVRNPPRPLCPVKSRAQRSNLRAGPAFSLLLLAGALAVPAALGQVYVTPKMGGGQVAADMIHIDLYYDEAANQLHAHVDDSYGTPQLRPLEPGYAFDPEANYSVLNGKAYNSQYGWNVGGLFAMPPGAAIWIVQTSCSPELEVYQDWGRYGSYAPIFGTDGSPALWKWSGVMVHNTYAVGNPATDRFFADYHIFFGDAATGSREDFSGLDDAIVHLEWTAVPVEDPLTFRFGALGQTNGAPLCFLNADRFVTNTAFVLNLHSTNSGASAGQFETTVPMLAVASAAACGGPMANHAAPGAHLELQLISLAGPARGGLGFWEPGDALPRFTLVAGEAAGTNRICLSESSGAPADDPYGRIAGRRYTVNEPGLYCLGFRVVDTSTNGPGNGPIHAPSEIYHVFLQAGLTVHSLAIQGTAATATFGGSPGNTYYLDRCATLGPADAWQLVAGPLAGTNYLQSLTDTAATNAHAWYRLRAQQD